MSDEQRKTVFTDYNFRRGDFVKHVIHGATVISRGPKDGVNIVWDEPPGSWSDNVPPGDLELVMHAIYLAPEPRRIVLDALYARLATWPHAYEIDDRLALECVIADIESDGQGSR